MTESLFASHPDSVLIVPTATMAEHLRHELARAHIAVRPSRIMTLARFLITLGAPPAPSPARLDAILASQLDKPAFSRFHAVAQYRGFRSQIASLFDEVNRADLPPDLAQLFDAVEQALPPSALRNRRLQIAANATTTLPGQIVFEGFFGLSRAERQLIDRIAARTKVIVTTPPAGGDPQRDLFSALSMEQEIEEIARRILHQHSRGYAFRDIGVILRARDPYAPALETAFARFGIPARFYFAQPLASLPAIDYVRRIVRAMLSGWDGAQLISAFRMPVSGIGGTTEGDHLDFEWRERLPFHSAPDPLGHLDAWRRDRVSPLEWSNRIAKLPVSPGVTVSTAFATALNETAAILSDREISLADFFHSLESVLELTSFRPVDRRRDVVHVMDVFEARQWRLPVVLIPGLVERQFPQHIREDSLLGDAARARAGLKTSADAQREERQLFELAITRATEQLTLSYPRFDEKGDPALRSFFVTDDAAPCQGRVRPRPSRIATASAALPIRDREALARQHHKLSVSAIESFLQCPFQFFAGKTLRLRRRPPAPRDRLDVLLQGSIMHASLAALETMPLLGAAVFDHVFELEAARHRVPMTYRTEAVRLEMLRNFESFLASNRMFLGWHTRVEESFEFALTPSLAIRGRIDRLDVSPANQALVIDYKYSAANTIREKIDDQETGNVVQAGLYLLVAQKHFGFVPVGMLYVGLKNKPEWRGWHVPLAALDRIGESCTPARLEELTSAAEANAVAAFESILAGELEPRPASRKKCDWCDFRDICRIEAK